MDDHVSDRIRKARRTADLTQSQAAQALGVHRGTFGHWERGGGHLPTSANLLHLGQTLDVSYEWLATGHGDMQGLSIDSEIPAVRLDCFAQSEQEESLLRSFRKLTAAKPEHSSVSWRATPSDPRPVSASTAATCLTDKNRPHCRPRPGASPSGTRQQCRSPGFAVRSRHALGSPGAVE